MQKFQTIYLHTVVLHLLAIFSSSCLRKVCSEFAIKEKPFVHKLLPAYILSQAGQERTKAIFSLFLLLISYFFIIFLLVDGFILDKIIFFFKSESDSIVGC